MSQDQAAPATTPALASGPWSPTPSPAPRGLGGLTHWPGRWRHPGTAAAAAAAPRASGRPWPTWAVSPSRLLSRPGLGAARWLRGTGAHRQPRTHTYTCSGNGRPAPEALFIRGLRPPAQGCSWRSTGQIAKGPKGSDRGLFAFPHQARLWALRRGRRGGSAQTPPGPLGPGLFPGLSSGVSGPEEPALTQGDDWAQDEACPCSLYGLCSHWMASPSQRLGGDLPPDPHFLPTWWTLRLPRGL